MEHQEPRSLLRHVLTVGMGFVTGLSIIIAIVSYQAYFAARSDFDALRVQNLRLMQRSLLFYGDIKSVDPDTRTVSIQFRNQFVSIEDPILLTVHITENTKLVKESLLGINGAYTSITDTENGTIEDLVPGMRVAALLDNVADEKKINAQVIFFGNPL